MEIIQEILSIYMQFFDWGMWKEVLTDPVSWGLISTLIIIEGLLSADNALVLAVLVKHLPNKQRKRALMYGMIGAYFFRFLFIGIGVYLVEFWFIKLLGALYLGWLCVAHFAQIGEEDSVKEVKKSGLLVRIFGSFWATVIMIELMDVAFSLDSILAAFAISNQVWVLMIGGMLGIVMMRTIAGLFLSVIEKIPELEEAAFFIIGIVALKMLVSIVGIHVPHYLFFIILIVVFTITFCLHFVKKLRTA
ncbi:TerC family protein [Metasolibacillus meyeri]|uniref:TerC family protein n=1 Tax=Metasolibacillus meyeri TaxID=1071052 RepID=A0AAW9NTL3_9BACL|nr:TerC family protein [Metasolibacillus meyeri]MEC1180840.1 TerC family protein [Metasolibacillus meyeri]